MFHSFSLPQHWGQPHLGPACLLVPFLALLLMMTLIEKLIMTIQGIPWICAYGKNSNTSGQAKALLNSSASCHAPLLPCGNYSYQFGMCPCLIPFSLLSNKFCEGRYNNWLVCFLLNAHREWERPGSYPWVAVGGLGCIYF